MDGAALLCLPPDGKTLADLLLSCAIVLLLLDSELYSDRLIGAYGP